MKKLASAAALVAAALSPNPAHARDAILGEIFIFAGNYCPKGSLPADGRELRIDQHSSLFSILGTRFGGDGHTTFALPALDGMNDRNRQEMRFCIFIRGTYPVRP